MNNPTPEWKWISAKLSGHISREDDDLLNGWLQQSPYNKSLFEEARKIWENSATKLAMAEPSTEEEWLRLQRRINRYQHRPVIVRWLDYPVARLSLAAAVLVSVLLGVYVFRDAETIPDLPAEEMMTYTSAGEVLTLFLPDSSKVWLNTNSELSYPKSYARRQIILKGEAYFIVEPDSLSPFTVSTSNSSTEVLGTSFNVQYTDSATTVTVARGKVQVKAAESENAVLVQPGQKAVVTDEEVTASKNENRNFASWRENNNPAFSVERNKPQQFLRVEYDWKKNQLNQSVLEGTLANSATLAVYRNVELSVTFVRPNGRKSQISIKLEDTLQPGQKVAFHKKLLDIFSKTEKVKVEVVKAEVNSQL